MKMLYLAGLAGLATLGAHAQAPGPQIPASSFESLVITATRAAQPVASLRDTVVITREALCPPSGSGWSTEYEAALNETLGTKFQPGE